MDPRTFAIKLDFAASLKLTVSSYCVGRDLVEGGFVDRNRVDR